MRRAVGMAWLCVALGCGGVEAGSPSDAAGVGGDGSSDSAVSFDLGLDSGADSGELPETLPDGRACPALDIDPPNAIIYIDMATSPPTPAVQTYSARIEECDGSLKDVTSEFGCSVDDPSVGSFKGNQFTSVASLGPFGAPAARVTHVHCCAEGVCADSNLTILQLRETGDHKDFYFIEPYLAPPSPDKDVLRFGTSVKQTDVAISVDSSSSDAPALDALKADLVPTIVPKLKAAIPSVGVGLATHEDFPVDGYGMSGCDLPARIAETVTTDLPTLSAAVGALDSHCGGDEPESQLAALLYVATGKELDWLGGSVPSKTPPPGASGGIGFRSGSLPLFVEISDAHLHDSTVTPYGTDVTTPPSTSDVVGAIGALHGTFVGVFDVHHTTDESQYDALSDATGSSVVPAVFGGGCGTGNCCTDVGGAGRAPDGPSGSCRLVFRISDGTGLADAIVEAVQVLSVGSMFDVTATASNDPANPPDATGTPLDATKFIKVLRAMDEGSPTDGCPAHVAKDTDLDGIKDTFVGVIVYTPVCFEIVPQMNTTVPTPSTTLLLDAFVDVLGEPGGVKLDRRTVLFLVPSK